MTADPDAFEQGHRATRENIPAEGNPYQDGSEQRALWAAGHEQVASAGSCHVHDALALSVEITALGVAQPHAARLLPLERREIEEPAAAVSLHSPGRVLKPRVPLAAAVPQHDDWELEQV